MWFMENENPKKAKAWVYKIKMDKLWINLAID